MKLPVPFLSITHVTLGMQLQVKEKSRSDERAGRIRLEKVPLINRRPLHFSSSGRGALMSCCRVMGL